jgi:hypothetical protein
VRRTEIWTVSGGADYTRRSRLGMKVGVLDDASVVRLNRALVVFPGIAGST